MVGPTIDVRFQTTDAQYDVRMVQRATAAEGQQPPLPIDGADLSIGVGEEVERRPVHLPVPGLRVEDRRRQRGSRRSVVEIPLKLRGGLRRPGSSGVMVPRGDAGRSVVPGRPEFGPVSGMLTRLTARPDVATTHSDIARPRGVGVSTMSFRRPGGHPSSTGIDRHWWSRLGLWNIYVTHTLRQTGPDRWVIADGQC
jgi:hypothetical protein